MRTTNPIIRKTISLLSISSILLLASCSENIDAEEPIEATPTSNLVIENTNTFASIKVSSAEFDYWNTHGINTPETTEKIKTLCKTELYSVLKDDFDFVIFVINNTNYPANMPTGEYVHVKNDTKGIGLTLFDNTASYGSAGKLQGVYFLYKNNIDQGPIIHEMTHRWANWVVPQTYAGHWDKVNGILKSVGNNLADIELYLMGLIPASQITDPESLAIYNDSRYVDKIRIPNGLDAQKSFNSLMVVITPTELTETEINNYKTKIDHITRTGATPIGYQNLWEKTNGKAILNIGSLNTHKK
jgi:hypothetical protein